MSTSHANSSPVKSSVRGTTSQCSRNGKRSASTRSSSGRCSASSRRATVALGAAPWRTSLRRLTSESIARAAGEGLPRSNMSAASAGKLAAREPSRTIAAQ